MRSIAILLALAASAFAYTVTEPSQGNGWTTAGPNVVSWQSVGSDRANVTIVLVNMQVSPPTSQVLSALVDGSLGKTTVNAPSGGWKAGKGFQVNLVQDAENTNAILAQSEQFSIAQSSTTLSPSSTSGSVLTVSPTGSATDAPGSSQTSTSPNSNGAPASMGTQASLFAGLALLGAFLA